MAELAQGTLIDIAACMQPFISQTFEPLHNSWMPEDDKDWDKLLNKVKERREFG